MASLEVERTYTEMLIALCSLSFIISSVTAISSFTCLEYFFFFAYPLFSCHISIIIAYLENPLLTLVPSLAHLH